MRVPIGFLLAASILSPQMIIIAKKKAAGGSSAPSLVQAKAAPGAYATNPSTTITFDSNATAGSKVFAFGGSGGTGTWNTPTGTGVCSGLSWTALGTPTANISAWAASVVSTGACTVTVSLATPGADAANVIGVEVAGATLTGVLVSTYQNFACDSCTGSTISSVPTDSLVLTFLAGMGGRTVTSPSPFTLDISANNSQGLYNGVGHYTFAAGGTYSPTWTLAAYANILHVSVAIPHP